MKRGKKSNIIIVIFIIIFILLLSYLVCSNIFYQKNNSTSKKDNINTTIKKNSGKEDKDETEVVDDNKVDTEGVKEDTSSIPKDEVKENKVQVESKNLNVSSIELIGEEEITINAGDNYTEYGAKAYNNEGEDISSEIKIDCSVDTSKQGRYTVSYSIGNWIVMRYVTVK